jgi:chromosomal replication initiator protein
LQNIANGDPAQISAINEALAKKVGAQKFRIWFKNSTKLTLTGGYLKVGVPNFFIASWIENHFLNEINQVVRAVTGTEVKLTFAIDPELSSSQRRTQLDSQASAVVTEEKARNRSRSYRNRKGTGSLLRKSPTPLRGSPTKISTVGGHQKKRLKLSLDTFIVGSSNELAYNAAKVVVNEQQSRVPPERGPSFNPLFIHGGYGLGKTHLLQGICNAVCKRRPQTNWLYLSAEDFANQFVLALKTKKLEAFRRRMRQTDLLAQVVLASDAPPKMIGQLSEKLVNRFVSGMVVKIQTPDFHTRCQICRQYAKQLTIDNHKLKIGKAVPESVIRYIAENLRTNVRELEGALLKIIAYSALAGNAGYGSDRPSTGEKINLSMAKAVLAEHLERCDPIVHISDIESAVATYFGITPANIHSSKKNRTIALARHFSMYLIRRHTKMSFSEIGRFMGNKNHATVLLACKKIEDLTKQNTKLNWQGPAGNKASKARAVLAQLEASI